jgi:hypothetical protein
MHDAHAVRTGPRVVTLQSKKRRYEIAPTPRSVEEIETLADDLGYLADDLKTAASAALGDGCSQLENALRLELGHDIETDIS